MEENHGLRVHRSTHWSKLFDVDLIIRQVTQITILVVTTNVEKVSVIWSLTARACWGNGIDPNAGTFVGERHICLSGN